MEMDRKHFIVKEHCIEDLILMMYFKEKDNFKVKTTTIKEHLKIILRRVMGLKEHQIMNM